MENKNNQGWSAYMNQKKENQELKKQLIVNEANQNGVRLTINDKGNFENVCTNTNALNPFRLIQETDLEKVDPLDEAEIQITKEIRALQEQLAFSKEVKRKKELYKETKTKEIEALHKEMTEKTLQYNLEMAFIASQIQELESQIKNVDINQFMNNIDDSVFENIDDNKKNTVISQSQSHNQIQENKRARNIVKRRPLYEVIKQPTQFKTLVKGIEFICYTEDGHKIISKDNNSNNNNSNSNNSNNIKTHSSLNEWLEYCISQVCNPGTTRKSVYEVVLYYNKSENTWKRLKTDYTPETIILN